MPTSHPSNSPSVEPTSKPTKRPSPIPTSKPTSEPSTPLHSEVCIGGSVSFTALKLNLATFIRNNGSHTVRSALQFGLPGVELHRIFISQVYIPQTVATGALYKLQDSVGSITIDWTAFLIAEKFKQPSWKAVSKLLMDNLATSIKTGQFIYKLNSLSRNIEYLSSNVIFIEPTVTIRHSPNPTLYPIGPPTQAPISTDKSAIPLYGIILIIIFGTCCMCGVGFAFLQYYLQNNRRKRESTMEIYLKNGNIMNSPQVDTQDIYKDQTSFYSLYSGENRNALKRGIGSNTGDMNSVRR